MSEAAAVGSVLHQPALSSPFDPWRMCKLLLRKSAFAGKSDIVITPNDAA